MCWRIGAARAPLRLVFVASTQDRTFNLLTIVQYLSLGILTLVTAIPPSPGASLSICLQNSHCQLSITTMLQINCCRDINSLLMSTSCVEGMNQVRYLSLACIKPYDIAADTIVNLLHLLLVGVKAIQFCALDGTKRYAINQHATSKISPCYCYIY